MTEFSTSVRVSETLKNKIIKEKNSEESLNKYLKNQILREENISESDFFYYEDMIQNDLYKAGNKINSLARHYNSFGVEQIDGEIIIFLKEYIGILSQLSERNIKSNKILYVEYNDGLPKDKNIRINLTEEEYNKLLSFTNEYNTKICDYIRFKLYNSVKYTHASAFILQKKLQHNVYRTINNLKQIIYQYSSSDFNAETETNLIQESLESIKRKYNIISTILRSLK